MRFLALLVAVAVFVLTLFQVHWFLVNNHGLYLGLAVGFGAFLLPDNWYPYGSRTP